MVNAVRTDCAAVHRNPERHAEALQEGGRVRDLDVAAHSRVQRSNLKLVQEVVCLRADVPRTLSEICAGVASAYTFDMTAFAASMSPRRIRIRAASSP